MAQYYRKLSKGIRWFYKFDLDGKTHFSKCIFLSKKEAQSAEREKYNALDDERRFGKKDRPLLLKAMIEDRLRFLEVKYSNGHKTDSEHYLNLFLDFTGNRDIRDISRKDVEDFLLDYSDKLLKSGVDNYQVNAALKTIKSILNYVIDSYDLTIKNPCKNIKPYPVKKKLKYIPPDDVIEKVRGKLNPRQRFFFDFVKETGARVNEIISLEYSDIKDNYVILYTRKSNNSDRVPRKVPLPVGLKIIPKRGRVFPEYSERPKFLDRTLRELKKTDHSIMIWGWHNLRHRYASLLSKSGEPIFSIMSKLGHSSVKTTQIYLQLLES